MKNTLRKTAFALAVAAVMTATALPASAATVDQTGTQAGTQFTYEYKNDPTYTVTIPDAVTLATDGAEVTIKAENVANLDGKKVSVTIAGTDYFRNQMVLSGKTESGSNATMRYKLELDDGTVVETTGGKDQVNGVELAHFTSDGEVTLKAYPILAASSSTVKGVTYTGCMTYGIALADAE